MIGAARSLAAAAQDAAIAGVIVGLADVALVASRAGFDAGAIPGTTAIVVGLTVLAVTLAGTPAVLLLRLLGRHPIGRPLAARLREPGPRRVEALTAIAVAVVALALVWLFGYQRVAYGHEHYRAAGAAGLAASTQIIVAAIVVAVLATAVAPPLARWLAGRRVLQISTTGRLGVGLAIAAAAILAFAIDATLDALAPAFDASPASVLVAIPVTLAAVACAAPSARLPWRARAIVAGVIAVVVAITVVALGRADRARGAIAAHGATSQLALRELFALTDGDGDGFSDRFGGGDCDDDDDHVYPGGAEVADNGKDDNCAGGDASASALTRRAAAQPSATPGAARRDLVLVTIDSLRADHTSVHGYARDTTPRLAALAATGAVFERAISPAPLTRWAVPALLFGRYASTLPYQGGRGGLQLRDHQLPTVASTLLAAGYATHASVSNDGVLNATATVGFAKVEAVSKLPVPDHVDNAIEVTDRALAWFGARPADQPCLLWVHYIDPHYPYEPPATAPRFGDADAYDREIAFTDAQLGRLIDGVRAARGPDVIIAVTADHGEAFGEHGTRFHGKSLYDEQVHVPLVIALPGAPPQRIATPVSLVDVGPTLLDLVGVTSPAGMNGWSVAAAIRGVGPVPEHDVLAELFRGRNVPRNLLALFRDRDVLIRDLDASTLELYDVATDPQQLHDRGDTARARQLGEALAAAADRELSALPGEELP